MQKNISSLSTDLRSIAQKTTDKISSIIPVIISTEGLSHFEESWDNQGFTDSNKVKWKRRKAPAKKKLKDGSESAALRHWREKNTGRAILVSHSTDTQGTHLKDSLKTNIKEKSVEFTTDKVYAQVHNEGGKSGRGNGFTMQQRQFMGSSDELNKKITQKIEKEMSQFFKSLNQ